MKTLIDGIASRLSGVCGDEGAELREWALARVRHWTREPAALFLQCRMDRRTNLSDEEFLAVDLEIDAVFDDAIILVRAAWDGCTETLVPLGTLHRARFIAKDGKREIELRHGECITWIARDADAPLTSDLDELFTAIRAHLGAR